MGYIFAGIVLLIFAMVFADFIANGNGGNGGM
jgi:hypothetical protein